MELTVVVPHTSENAAFPDMRPTENPHWVEVRAAHRGGFSGRVPRRKQERTPGGHEALGTGVLTDAVSDAATPVCTRPTTPAFVKQRARALR